MKFDIWIFFGNLSSKFKFHQNLTRIKCTYSTWRPIYILYHISLSFFLAWKYFQAKVVAKLETHILCSITFFWNLAVYENVEDVARGRPQMTICRMLIACWTSDATNTLIICNTYCFSTATLVARTLPVLLHTYSRQFHHMRNCGAGLTCAAVIKRLYF
jgi:hypothetical protein